MVAIEASGLRQRVDAPASHRQPVRLRLLGGFSLVQDGSSKDVPRAAQRLLAYLALHPGQDRTCVAGTLWPEASEAHALGSLRSVLWRLHRDGPRLESSSGTLALPPEVHVDVQLLQAALRRSAPGPGELVDDAPWWWQGAELLPGWYDDWVCIQRERHRQLRLHAGEAAADALSTSGRFGDALQVALQVVAWEPLRESAQRLVIRLHLAEGNLSEARRHYDEYRRLLQRELGLGPSQGLTALLQHAETQRVRALVDGATSDLGPVPRQVLPAGGAGGFDGELVRHRGASPAGRVR